MQKAYQVESGFVALFFIISISVSLAGLVFLVSQFYSYELQLADEYRVSDNARSSALYCRDVLYSRMFADPLYKLTTGDFVYTDHGEKCRFTSFTEHLTQSDTQSPSQHLDEQDGSGGELGRGIPIRYISADIEGSDKKQRFVYKLRYTFKVTGDYVAPIVDVHSIQLAD